MRLRSLILLVLPFLLSSPSVIAAQETVFPDPGARIRVQAKSSLLSKYRGLRASTYPRTATVTGTLVSLDEDALVLRIENQDSVTTIPRSSVRRFDVSRGGKNCNKAAPGAIIGFVIGAPIGAVIGAYLDEVSCISIFEEPDPSCGGYVLPTAVVVGVVGAIVGYEIGLQSGEKWQEISLDEAWLSLSLRFQRHLGLAFSLRF